MVVPSVVSVRTTATDNIYGARVKPRQEKHQVPNQKRAGLVHAVAVTVAEGVVIVVFAVLSDSCHLPKEHND